MGLSTDQVVLEVKDAVLFSLIFVVLFCVGFSCFVAGHYFGQVSVRMDIYDVCQTGEDFTIIGKDGVFKCLGAEGYGR